MEQKWLRTTALEYLCFAPKRLVKLTPFSFFFDSNDTTFAAISLKFNQFFWRFFFQNKNVLLLFTFSLQIIFSSLSWFPLLVCVKILKWKRERESRKKRKRNSFDKKMSRSSKAEKAATFFSFLSKTFLLLSRLIQTRRIPSHRDSVIWPSHG